MAEPFSIVASLLTVAAAVIQSSKAVMQIIDGFKAGSKELAAVARDTQAIYHTVSTLHATLHDGKLCATTIKTDLMLLVVESLSNPLLNCQIILDALILKMEGRFKPCTKDGERWTGLTSVKWVLSTKHEIQELQSQLEAAKTTLITTLSAMSMICGVRLLAIVDKPASTFPTGINGFYNTKVAIYECGEGSVDSELNPASPTRETVKLEYLKQERSEHGIKTMNGREQTAKTSQTDCQGAFSTDVLGGNALGQCLGHISRELAENKALLQTIHKALKAKVSTADTQITNTVIESMTHADDFCDKLFSDCVSRSSEDDDFYSYIDELSRPITPSPMGFLETSSNVYPERLAMDGFFKDQFFVISEQMSATEFFGRKYFILYAETPRRWQKLTVSATFEATGDQVAILGADIPHDSQQMYIALPKIVKDDLKRLTSRMAHFSAVTNVSLSFKPDERGLLVSDHATTKISEDNSEVSSSHERQMLQDIDDMECKQFLESEIITRYRKSTTCFVVFVENQTCVERKAPFVASGIRGGNGLSSFFKDLQFLKSLRGCKGAAQFIGVVLDDTRAHLRSYLYEHPPLGSLLTILKGANSNSEILPWDVREVWARQVVDTVAEIHSDRSALVGNVRQLMEIGIRANGNIVFTGLHSSQKYLAHKPGLRAPELRGLPLSNTTSVEKLVTFRTEIFQLGLLLWMLAEHIDNLAGCFCPRYACTNRPQHSCTLEHADPIGLPTCNAGVPPYFNEIIRQSRFTDPTDRATARQLQDMFPIRRHTDEAVLSRRMDLLRRCARPAVFEVYCNECGSRDMSVNYKCRQCCRGDFEICEACFNQGILCLDSDHRLVKMIEVGQNRFEAAHEQT